MLNPIIAGADPQRGDDAPLRLAAELARIAGAPLVAIASYPQELAGTRTSGMLEADLRAKAAARLETLASGVNAELEVIGGASAARVLHDAAVARSASMIVVGSTHLDWLGPLTAGSTAERLLQRTPCPVAVAPAELGNDWTPRRIGVGFVDLEDGRAALRYGAALAAAADARLRALTAVAPLDWSRPAAIAPYQASGGLEAAQAAARRALYLAIGGLPTGVAATTDVVVGHAADTLIGFSAEVELLVCGSRGHGPFPASLLGSVTRRLARAAACPVVIVPHDLERSIERFAGQGAASAR